MTRDDLLSAISRILAKICDSEDDPDLWRGETDALVSHYIDVQGGGEVLIELPEGLVEMCNLWHDLRIQKNNDFPLNGSLRGTN